MRGSDVSYRPGERGGRERGTGKILDTRPPAGSRALALGGALRCGVCVDRVASEEEGRLGAWSWRWCLPRSGFVRSHRGKR